MHHIQREPLLNDIIFSNILTLSLTKILIIDNKLKLKSVYLNSLVLINCNDTKIMTFMKRICIFMNL